MKYDEGHCAIWLSTAWEEVKENLVQLRQDLPSVSGEGDQDSKVGKGHQGHVGLWVWPAKKTELDIKVADCQWSMLLPCLWVGDQVHSILLRLKPVWSQSISFEVLKIKAHLVGRKSPFRMNWELSTHMMVDSRTISAVFYLKMSHLGKALW